MLSPPFEPSIVGEAVPPQRQTFPNSSVPLSFRKDFTVLSHWTPMNMCPVVRAGTHPLPPDPSPKLVSTSQAQARLLQSWILTPLVIRELIETRGYLWVPLNCVSRNTAAGL